MPAGLCWQAKINYFAAKGGYTFTKSAGKHLTEVVKRGENAGQLARPYMKSPLTIQEIVSTGKGIPDATFKGGMNWKVPGTFRGSQGIWELPLNLVLHTPLGQGRLDVFGGIAYGYGLGGRYKTEDGNYKNSYTVCLRQRGSKN